MYNSVCKAQSIIALSGKKLSYHIWKKPVQVLLMLLKDAPLPNAMVMVFLT